MDGTRSASKWTVGWEVSYSCCSLICVLFPYFIWQMIYLPFTLQMWCFQLWGYIMGTLYLVTAMGRYESHASGWSCWFSGTTPWYSSRGGSCHSRDNREMLADVSMLNLLHIHHYLIEYHYFYYFPGVLCCKMLVVSRRCAFYYSHRSYTSNCGHIEWEVLPPSLNRSPINSVKKLTTSKFDQIYRRSY